RARAHHRLRRSAQPQPRRLRTSRGERVAKQAAAHRPGRCRLGSPSRRDRIPLPPLRRDRHSLPGRRLARDPPHRGRLRRGRKGGLKPKRGTLYLVGTPIGNLDDISSRAIETLRQVRLVACEDTRRTRILLDRFGIETPTTALPAFDEERRAPRILERLRAGDDVALVTDAGMPGISDPGEALVRLAVEEGVQVVPIPGPSAALAALAASGLPTSRFAFFGFLPRKGKARRETIAQIAAFPGTCILYESPRRLAETLRDLQETLGDRRACVAR